MVEPGRITDLGEEPVHDPSPVHEMATDDLEHLHPSHELVSGHVNHAHAAAPQLAENLIIRVVGERRRHCAGGRRCRSACGEHQTVERRNDRVGVIGLRLGIAETSQKGVRRQRGRAGTTGAAHFQMLVDRCRRAIVEFAETVRSQRLIVRVEGVMGFHGPSPTSKSKTRPSDRHLGVKAATARDLPQK